MTKSLSRVDRSTSEHYTWGTGCDGWRLLADTELSVTEERVPPGAAETRHLHSEARQFFYVLHGRATLELDDRTLELAAGQGLHVPPRAPHRFVNRSADDVVFLVISSPTTVGDRTDLGSASTCVPGSAST